MAQLPLTFRGASSKGKPPEPPGPKRLTVSELNQALRQNLEHQFRRVFVEGEIRGLQVQPRSGHAYFSLADAQCSVSVFMSQLNLKRLKFPIEEGLHVLLEGEASVYEPRGRLQLRARGLEPIGEGALILAFRAHVAKLEAEGLTHPQRKQPIPYRARPIGVVTSKSGAALRDVIRTALRRDPSAHLVIAPSLVQGPGSASGIIRALKRLDRAGCGVILLVRGGGRLDDLQAFNEEQVARAVAACQTPIVTGVGHETDTTLVDLVADARASTPTAAAEMVVPELQDLQRGLRQIQVRMRRALHARLVEADRDLKRHQMSLRSPIGQIARGSQRVDEVSSRLDQAMTGRMNAASRRLQRLERRLGGVRPEVRLETQKNALSQIMNRLQIAQSRQIERHRRRIERVETQLQRRVYQRFEGAQRGWARTVGTLEALSPLAVLARGYATVSTEAGLVRSPNDVKSGQRVRVRVSQGMFSADVVDEEPTQ